MWLLIVIRIAKTNCSSNFPAAYSYYTLMFLHIGEGEVRDSEDRESHNGLKNIFEGSLHEESCFKNLGGIQ